MPVNRYGQGDAMPNCFCNRNTPTNAAIPPKYPKPQAKLETSARSFGAATIVKSESYMFDARKNQTFATTNTPITSHGPSPTTAPSTRIVRKEIDANQQKTWNRFRPST